MKKYLSENQALYFVTFSGLSKAIDFVKNKLPRYKMAVITNGTLFNNKKARDEVRRADVLLPSLDAASVKSFFKINRPGKNLDINRIIGRLASLRKEFKGEIRLEIFLLPDINDGEEKLVFIKETRAKNQSRPDSAEHARQTQF